MKKKDLINIGADEIILWFRKNNKFSGISNRILGRRIKILICKELKGEEIEINKETYWNIKKKNSRISEFKLPKTASQYSIQIDKLNLLFKRLKTM